MPIRCTQNPTMGEEWRRGWDPETIKPKKTDQDVLVVGSGPAGLSAAIRLKQLDKQFNTNHSVCIIEKGSEVGAHIISGAILEPSALDELIPDSFAIVREAAKRTLKQRHFDVQLMGGLVLHHGGIAEMKTGEGKTLVATLAGISQRYSRQ